MQKIIVNNGGIHLMKDYVIRATGGSGEIRAFVGNTRKW